MTAARGGNHPNRPHSCVPLIQDKFGILAHISLMLSKYFDRSVQQNGFFSSTWLLITITPPFSLYVLNFSMHHSLIVHLVLHIRTKQPPTETVYTLSNAINCQGRGCSAAQDTCITSCNNCHCFCDSVISCCFFIYGRILPYVCHKHQAVGKLKAAI